MEDVGEREDRGETEACLAFIRLSDGAQRHSKEKIFWRIEFHIEFSLLPKNRSLDSDRHQAVCGTDLHRNLGLFQEVETRSLLQITTSNT